MAEEKTILVIRGEYESISELWDTQHRDYKYRENKMLHFFK
jgi:hypothetical protein